MAKLTQTPVPASAQTQSKSPIVWKLYPVAWCLIGITAGAYVFTSDTSAKIVAFLNSDRVVVERRVSDSETRASEAVRALDRAKSELREERSRVVALNIRIDKLTSELRTANAAKLKSASATPNTDTSVTQATEPTDANQVRTAVVNTTPVAAPDTSRLVTVNAPPPPAAVVAVVDKNAPPLPTRVPQQARAAALASARLAPETSNITTGSIGAETRKLAERAPSAATTPPAAPPAASTWTAQTPSQPPAPAAGPTVTANVNAAALRLATAPSLISLRQSWAVLMDRHPDILQGLSPRYRDITTANGRSYQLIAGPLLSRGEAIQLCAMLQVQAVGCGVDTYAGDAL